MIITISGTPGAGDTTTTEMLAEELGYETIEVGEIQKRIAREEGLDSEKLWEKQEENPEALEEFHRKLDSKQKKIAREKDNLIINGKLSAHHIENADLKILLTADIEERAKRTLMREKKGREEFAETVEKEQEYKEPSKEEIQRKVREIKKREKKETEHWKELYGFNYIEDKEEYDLLIDTTDKKPMEVVNLIKKEIERSKND